MTELATAAFQRLVEALNHSRDGAVLRAAVTDDVQLERHGPAARGEDARIAESFAGVDEVGRWFARMPTVITFSLAGDARADGDDRWAIEYAYDAPDIHHGGMWHARLAADGRIAALSHRPFALAIAGAATQAHGHDHSGHDHGGHDHSGHDHGHGDADASRGDGT